VGTATERQTPREAKIKESLLWFIWVNCSICKRDERRIKDQLK
jgi:hypothetical protein